MARLITAIFTGSILVGSTAAAQGTDTAPPPTTTGTDTTPPTTDQPPQQPPPPVVTSPPPPPVRTQPPPPPEPVEEDDDGPVIGTGERPGSTFGLGVGWTFPGTEVWVPSTVAARFRLTGGITIEPSINVTFDGSSTDTGTTTVDTKNLNVGFGTQLRIPITSLGPIDFLFLGTAAIAYGVQLDPDTVHDLSFTVGYGLGLEFWFTTRWSVSLDATNPFVSVTWNKDESGFAGDQTQVNYSVGAVWGPRIRLLITLYLE